MKLHYLEIVTPDVDGFCEIHARQNGSQFGDPQEALGNARVASLADGGQIGVRAPMHDAEEPVARPYFLVDDIDAATSSAAEAGAEIMVPPMEIPGMGRCSILLVGGIQQGYWQL